MAYGMPTYGGSVDETDEEMERRLLAEISARTQGASPEQTSEDAAFESTIANIAGPSQARQQPQPQPRQQRSPVPPATPRTTEAPQRDPQSPEERERRVAPFVDKETATATGLGGDQYGVDAMGRPRRTDPSITGIGGGVNLGEIQASEDRRRRQASIDLRDQARREQRRERIMRGLALAFGAMGAPGLTAAFAGGSNMVRNDARSALADRRREIAQRYEQELAQREQRRQEMLQGLEAKQRQANEDRNFELRREDLERDEAYRQAALEQRGEQFEQRQGLAERRHEFQVSRADLDRAARERNARIVAGQAVAPGGSSAAPSSRPGGARDLEAPTVSPDALVIQSIIDTRGEQIDPVAQAEYARLRGSGEQVDYETVRWAVARRFYDGLGEKDRRAVQRAYAMPQSSTSEATTESASRRRDAEHRVPGWSRDANAPELGVEERSRARNVAAANANVQRFTRRMEQLAQEVNGIEATAANARIVSERMAEAAQVHEQLINELRTIGNYGVPQAAELARMEALAPRLSSREYFVGSAPGIYRAMRSTLDQRAAEQMRSLGYTRGGDGSASPSSSQWRPIGRTADGGVVYENAAGERRVRRPQ